MAQVVRGAELLDVIFVVRLFRIECGRGSEKRLAYIPELVGEMSPFFYQLADFCQILVGEICCSGGVAEVVQGSGIAEVVQGIAEHRAEFPGQLLRGAASEVLLVEPLGFVHVELCAGLDHSFQTEDRD